MHTAYGLAYTPDGSTLISTLSFAVPEKGQRASMIRVFARDASTGQEITARRMDFDVGEVGLHHLTTDGAALLGFTLDFKFRIWDLAKGGETATLDVQAADPSIERAAGHFMTLSPDRKTLVWQMGPTTLVWDVATKKIRLKHYQSLHWSFAVALSPDGKMMACHRGGPPHVVQLWALDAGKQVAELTGFAGHVTVLTYSPDGKLLATADEFGTIRLMDVATGNEVAALKGHGGIIRSLVFAPNGQWLYSAGQDGLVSAGNRFPTQTPMRSTTMWHSIRLQQVSPRMVARSSRIREPNAETGGAK